MTDAEFGPQLEGESNEANYTVGSLEGADTATNARQRWFKP